MPHRMTDSFEGSLAALRPAPAGVGQASFYFRAGQVSREHAVHVWQIVAGIAAVLLLTTVGICGWRIADAEARVAEAEAKRLPPTVIPVPAEMPIAQFPPNASADEDVRPYSPPLVPPAAEDGMTPGEIASALELRRSILTAGVSYLDAQPRFHRSISRTR